ncbi:hypothetical protein L6164_009203 [Bauhinia variegata]|uniref:Uncharacterized protein n=1 Tax=Bauhinia variegata TaxID=167791 RepID=A0ACB9PKA0_BAUVA|nr:hypothetical protein L6164_009203 [Bauhinia variegata]
MKGGFGSVSVEMDARLVEKVKDRVGHISKVGYVKRVISKKKKPCRRNKQLVPVVPKVLQELFVSCQQVFKGFGTVPSPEEVDRLCHIIDQMKPEDVGLSRELQFFKPGNLVKENLRVTYTTIYKCSNFSLCIFFLPAKGVIPLHNHPEMTVFSKLLLGKMHIKSYDWADPDPSGNISQPSKLRLANLKANTVFTAPCDTSVLYPTRGGNIHEFTAITPCAVLDVLGPPYSKEDGRDCSYYKDHPFSAFPNGETGSDLKIEESDSYGWLEEIEKPENSDMDGIEYLGPSIIKTECVFGHQLVI